LTDIAVSLINNMFQLEIANGDLVGDDGLETAVLISLFSDKRVSVNEIPDQTTDRRGYWGDLIADVSGDVWGSKLWIYDRSKLNNPVVAQIEIAVKDALKWLVDDKIAKTIDVEAARADNNFVYFTVKITKPTDSGANIYGFLWDGQELKRA
jgi:phage gp46-like protein